MKNLTLKLASILSECSEEKKALGLVVFAYVLVSVIVGVINLV